MDDGHSINHEPQPSSGQAFKVYKRRWFILTAVCVVNCSNAMVGTVARGVSLSFLRRFSTPPAAPFGSRSGFLFFFTFICLLSHFPKQTVLAHFYSFSLQTPILYTVQRRS